MKPGEAASDALNQTCEGGIQMYLFWHCSLVPALVIIGVLSFLQQREGRWALDQRLPALSGRFGMVVPLDVIGSQRWSYGFAFGAVASTVLFLFSEPYVPFSVPSWATAFVYLLGALEVGLIYYPFFACLSTPFQMVGSMLGIIYTMGWIVASLWDMVACPSGSVLGRFQKPILQWPRVLCLIFLLVRFTVMLVKAICNNLRMESDEGLKPMLQNHQAKYVQALLRGHARLEEESVSQGRLKSWFERKIYKWDPYFKFPSRMIGTSIICFVGLYTMTVVDYGIFDYTFDNLDHLVHSLSLLVSSCNATENQFGKFIPQLEHFSKVARSTWLATTIFASLTSVTHTFHVLVCYRKHLKRLWAGQKNFMPQRFHNPSSAVSAAAITRYAGWQIAYTMWGYLIIHFVQFLLGLLLVYGLVLPIQQGRGLAVLYSLGSVLLTMGVVIGLVILQVVLVQVFFLQEKISPTDKQKPLALNNRKAFHNFTYFFFFYNVMIGLGNCMLRLVVSMVLGTWLVARIDRTIVQRGYEALDPGYSTWIGMIFADHYHSNPVMICFCHLLLAERREREGRTPSQFNAPTACVSGLRARKRWFLFYTLLKNPELTALRRLPLPFPQPSLETTPQDRLPAGCALGILNGWSEAPEAGVYETDA